MKSYNTKTYKTEDTPKKVIDFLEDIIKVYEKHNLSIFHEDSGGSFVIEKYSEENSKRLKDASLYF